MEEGLLSLKWNNHHTTLVHLLKVLREQCFYTDALLVCGSRFFGVHRLVLMACSDYFCDIFSQVEDCPKPVVVLQDIDSSELEALLDYMYLGEVDVHQNKLPNLIKAAECLHIKGLATNEDDPTKPLKSFMKNKSQSSSNRPYTIHNTSKHKVKSFNDKNSEKYTHDVESSSYEQSKKRRRCSENVRDTDFSDNSMHDVQYSTESRLENCRVQKDPHSVNTNINSIDDTNANSRRELNSGGESSITENSKQTEVGVVKKEESLNFSDVSYDEESLSQNEHGSFSLLHTDHDNMSTDHEALNMSADHEALNMSAEHEVKVEHPITDMEPILLNSPEDVSGNHFQHYLHTSIDEHLFANTSQSGSTAMLPSVNTAPQQAVDLFGAAPRLSCPPLPPSPDLRCPQCSRLFTDKYKRDRHLLIHTGLKPYQCPFCQYRSSRKDPVIRHMKFKHPEQMVPVDSRVVPYSAAGHGVGSGIR